MKRGSLLLKTKLVLKTKNNCWEIPTERRILMDHNMMVLIIVLGACVLIAGGAYFGNFLSKKKIDVSKVEWKAVLVASAAQAFALAIAPFLPAKYGSILSKLAISSYKGVDTVEALWKASVLPEEKRKATATSLIQSEFQQSGIQVDDEVNKLISVSVDLMCRFMPKSHTVPATPAAQTAAESGTIAPNIDGVV
jgi:hypothetical protein